MSAHITRRPGPVSLSGLHANSLASLKETLARHMETSQYLVADLSYGSWRSYQAAVEFGEQLGLDPPWSAPPPAVGSAPTPAWTSHGELIGARIDAETKGHRTTLAALELARRLVSAVLSGPSRAFVVLAPRYGIPWDAEEVLFLRFLALGLEGTPHRLILVSTAPDATPPPGDCSVHWLNRPEMGTPQPAPQTLLGLVPGIVEGRLAGLLGGPTLSGAGYLLPLNGERVLIAPECRRPPDHVPKGEYDRLAQAVQGVGWLVAYANFHGHGDARLLSASAGLYRAEGGASIALRLLEAAASREPDPNNQAAAQAQLQGLRIVLQRFDEIASAPEPDERVWPQLRAILLEAKGWGLTMLDQPGRARPYLEQARHLLDPDQYAREYLYLLNISALSLLKAGDLTGAMALEQEISARLASAEHRDWHLEYINCINLARLYQRLRDYDRAEHHFQRAFSTSLGVRSSFDGLYANFCLGRLHIERSDIAAAFPFMLRAALHWAANEVPEAISGRVAGAILKRQPAAGEDVTEAVSGALLDMLVKVAVEAGSTQISALAERDLAEISAPVFLYAEAVPSGYEFCYAVSGNGWSVLTGKAPLPPQYDGPAYVRLRAAIAAVLDRLNPAGLVARPAIAIDDRLGHEIAATPSELLATCLRLRVDEMRIGDEAVGLTPEVRSLAERWLRVRLGSAVDRVSVAGQQARVSFKRYSGPLTLTLQQSYILAMLEDQASLGELAASIPEGSFGGVLAGLRSLERLRVIELYLSEHDDVPQRLVSGSL